MDLFGTYDGYVLPFEDIKEKDEILKAFQTLMNQEEALKRRYKEFLPGYKKQLTDAIEKYIFTNCSKTVKCVCDREQCVGCGACVFACPNDCITMREDEEGFEYPEIDKTKCINCQKCKKVCPVVNKPKDDLVKPRAFAVVNKSYEQRMKSSSGGLFSAIASKILRNGGVVCAPAFCNDFELKHIIVDDIKDLASIMGSKYIQSRAYEIYSKVEEHLKAGKCVLFSGTPCQIGGLKAYLGKEYDNLILQDIICHGVPSPKAWKCYLNYRKTKAKSDKVEGVTVRHKMQDGNSAISIRFDSEKEYCENYQNDTYIKSYLSNGNIRKSCGDCSFKQEHRQSDITLADFWGADSIVPEMNDNKGVSLALLHSPKGLELIDSIQNDVQIKEVDYFEAIKRNMSYTHSVKRSPCAEAFFKKMNSKNFDKNVNKYFGKSKVSKIRRKIYKIFN